VRVPGTPLLRAVHEDSRYVPDFLTPPARAGERSLDDELALVAATPLPVVAAELDRCRSEGSDHAALRGRPAALRAQAVRELRAAWESLLRPHWPRLHRVLAHDVDHRSRRLVSGGTAALLDDLHPDVSWAAGTLRVRSRTSDRRDLRGEGVVLMPSAFGVGRPIVVLDPPYQPTLVYPARGLGTAWSEPVAPAGALVRLMGRGRAELLALLDEPAGTVDLARRLGRSPGTTSEHLSALRAAGLADVIRQGKASRWSRTPLGDALVAGPVPD
jgi:DNA-binding transcriptional ArsR family regulator